METSNLSSAPAPQGSPASTLPSRRALREAQEGPSRQTRRSRRPAAKASESHRWLARSGVLASLAAATIVIPITAGSSSPGLAPQPASAYAPAGLSTLDVLTSERSVQTEAVIVADADLLAARDSAAVSRAAAREELPACDITTPVTSSNGQLRDAELCALWQDGHRQQPEATLSLTALNDAFRAKFGRDICLTDSYRTYGSQQRVAWTKPGLAAVPGRSMHGWGLAIDLCGESYSSSAVWNWLKANGPVYGWDNPAWARPGGSGPLEPWHWEYTSGVEDFS